MGAVDTDSPRMKYLSTKEGKIECYDNGTRTLHKAWKGYFVGHKYRTPEDGAKYGTELHIYLAEDSQMCDLGMVLKSGTARGFMRAIENVNLKQPITFRPWSYTDETTGKIKTGGLNLEQGGRQVMYKYQDTADGCGDMPLPQTLDNGDGTSNKNFGAQIIFLRNILDTVIGPKVAEIVEMGAFEEEDFSAIKQIAPSLGNKQLAAHPVNNVSTSVPSTAVVTQHTDGTVPDPEGDDLPF